MANNKQKKAEKLKNFENLLEYLKGFLLESNQFASIPFCASNFRKETRTKASLPGTLDIWTVLLLLTKSAKFDHRGKRGIPWKENSSKQTHTFISKDTQQQHADRQKDLILETYL